MHSSIGEMPNNIYQASCCPCLLPPLQLLPPHPASFFPITVRYSSALAWAGVSPRHRAHAKSFPCLVSQHCPHSHTAQTLLHGRVRADFPRALLWDRVVQAVSDSAVGEFVKNMQRVRGMGGGAEAGGGGV